MVTLRLKGTNLSVSLTLSNYTQFNNCIRVLKDMKFRFNPNTKEWLGPWHKRDEVKAELEDYDTIEDHTSETELQEVACGKPEQTYESTRRLADYSLMNYPPVTGKHPNEDFQKKGIVTGINTNRYYYAWDCGSGKSYVTSALIAHRLLKYKDCGKVVLITSTIGVRNLYHELFKFIKDLDENRVEIANKDNRNPFDHKDKDIIIMSYNTWRLVCEYYKKQLKLKSKMPKKPFLPLKQWSEGKELMLMLDEAHAIDSPKSQQSQYMRLHCPLFKYRYFFSATPFDKIEKEWCPLTCLDPWLTWKLPYTEWLDKMAYLGDRFSMYSVREWKQDAVEEQRNRFLKSYGNFYKTTDLIDLPEYLEKRIYLDMSPKHREIYQQFVTQSLPSKGRVRDIVNLFPYLSLSLDDPTLLEKHFPKFDINLQKMVQAFKYSYLEKLTALDEILSDHKGEKVLVWATHPKTIKMIAEQYPDLKPIVITGETPQDERFKLIDEFKTGDHQLLCGNISCLNTSVTLTECACQVYFSRPFNYTEVAQSQCRIYRLGQTREVESYILLYNRSIDILLDKNLASKGMLVTGLASKDYLSQDEWVKIFNCEESSNFAI